MNFIKPLLRAILSRTFMVLLLFVVFALLVWFLGPYVGFGGFTPLEAASSRMVLLILSLSLLLFWLLHWPVSIVGVTALCLVIWYGAPFVSVGGSFPFAPSWTRILIISVIGAVFAVYLGYRFWQAVQANDALLRKLLRPRLGALESPAKEQLIELQGIMGKAMSHLRDLQSGVRGIGRVLQGKRYIYELPWFMIIGAPGTGKTTAIRNSELRFPLADQLGTASLAGVSGTRNCVWWFTNEAVLIDTAGRYTTHETNVEVDSAEWKGFLRLLRKHRTRAPINGAILTVSVEQLIGREEREITHLAASLRERLLELQQELGIRFPVYLMITKMDRLKGFKEYFYQLNRKGRNQVWGFTLPYEEEQQRRRTITEIRDSYEGELRLLAGRLEEGLPQRLREEYSIARRRELYCLPGEFRSLFEPLLRLAERIFFESRYESSRMQNVMRGIYFTSAVQGDSPLMSDTASILQRLKNFMSDGQPFSDSGREQSPQPAAPGHSPKSYFIHDLLRKLIFPEAALVKPNTRWEWRLSLIRKLGHLLVLLLAIGAAGSVLTSRTNSAETINIVEDRVGQLRETLNIVNESNRVDLLPYVLEGLCSLTTVSGNTMENQPLPSMRSGLFSLNETAEVSQRVCEHVRERVLLPQAVGYLEDRLIEAFQEARKGPRTLDKDMALYGALRYYLILHSLEPDDPGKLMDWFMTDLLANPAASFLSGHDNLPEQLEFTLRRLADNRSSRERDTKVNTDLVRQAREHISWRTREEILYALMKKTSLPKVPADFVPVRHMDAAGVQVLRRASGRSLTEGLPGLFTYDGYHNAFLPGLKAMLPGLLEDDSRVMFGSSAPVRKQAGNNLEIKQFTEGILKLYYEEYTAVWRDFLKDVTVATGLFLESYLNMLNILAGVDSPLEQLAKAVVRETALSVDSGPTASLIPDSPLTRQLTDRARMISVMDEISQVDIHFSAFRRAVTGNTKPARTEEEPVDSQTFIELRELYGEYAAHIQEVIRAIAAKTPPPPSLVPDKLLAKAVQLPPFFSGVLETLARGGTELEGKNRGHTLAQIMETELSAKCRLSMESRYPFSPDGRDANPADIASLLGPGGAFDVFFQTYLAPLVDRGEKWAYHLSAPGAPDLTPFARAADLRELLFSSPDGNNWGVSFEVSVLEMDPRIERADIVFGENSLSYDHGPVTPMRVDWSGVSAKAVAEITVRPRGLGVPPLRERGSWAFMRLFQKAHMVEGYNSGQFWFEFDLNGHKLTLEVTVPGENPLDARTYASFFCPR